MLLREISDRAKVDRETRAFTVDGLEVREAEDGKITFDGVASVVDTPYKVRDMFGEYDETMARGAFNRTIKQKSDVRLLVNHAGVPLARTKSKTLTLSADPHLRALAPGLDPSNPTVQEIRSALGRGDIDQMSVGFRVKDQDWNEDYTERTIREVELFDVSIVTYPASPTTSALIRSIDEFLDSLTDVDLEADEIQRAIKFFTERLPQPEPTQGSGFYVSDDLRSLWAARMAPVAA